MEQQQTSKEIKYYDDDSRPENPHQSSINRLGRNKKTTHKLKKKNKLLLQNLNITFAIFLSFVLIEQLRMCRRPALVASRSSQSRVKCAFKFVICNSLKFVIDIYIHVVRAFSLGSGHGMHGGLIICFGYYRFLPFVMRKYASKTDITGIFINLGKKLFENVETPNGMQRA